MREGEAKNKSYNTRAIGVLVRREFHKLFKERSRMMGIVLQPFLFWLMLGLGFSPSFRPEESNLSFSESLLPGIVVLVVFLTAIF